MVTKVNGTKGKNGKSRAHPTDGTDGGDADFTQNGAIAPVIPNIQANGGKGGNGGKNTGAGNGNGGNGGNGGNANVTMNGNILQPTTTSAVFSGAATGGDGGIGGTPAGTGMAGTQGNGGNATVTMDGNILQPSKTMTTIEMDAFAVGGTPPDTGGQVGNATATLNGNIVQVAKATSVTLDASASTDAPTDNTTRDGDGSFGTKKATVDGNIVNGNITNVTLEADAFRSNASATLSGNIVQDTAASGKVTLEGTGQHIDIENNKVTIGKGQQFDLAVNELSPAYDATIKGNAFTGAGSNNTFVFTDNGVSGTGTPTPSATPDTIVIDLGNNSFMFDGKNNKLQNFTAAEVGGNNVNATVIGTAGNDTFIAGTGTDTYNGGGGNNTISYINGVGPNGVSVNLGLQPAQQPIGGGFGPDTLINIQNVIGTNFNDTLTGDANANILSGGLGDDILFATAGGDTLDGGAGTDTADFSLDTGSGVTVDLNVQGAPQTVGGSIGTITLTSIENVIGSAFDDTLIAGLGGAETLDGGSAGSDTADFRHGTSGVTVDLNVPGTPQTVGGGVGAITLNNVANVTGSAFDDTLAGNSGNNTLSGGMGNDTLIATNGRDVLNGGAGTDTADFRNFAGGVTIDLSLATAQSLGGGNTIKLQSIENVTGGAGDDTLIAGGGASTLNGGLGDDTLVVGSGADTLIGGGGTDTASFANFSTGVNISLLVAGSQSDGAGSVTLSGISNLTGGSGNDTLTAGPGAGTLIGGGGNDTLNGNGVNTTASFIDSAAGVTASLLTGMATGDGNDTLNGISNLTGSAFDDTLTAGAGPAVLIGGAGNDTLIGGSGNTILFGGSGTNTIIGIGGLTNLNVAYYAGSQWQYTTNPTLTFVNGGPAGDTSTDSLSNIDRLKFLSPSQAGDMNHDGYGDLVFQNTDDDFQVRLQGAGLSQTVESTITGGAFSTWKAIGSGQFASTPDASVLVQQSGTGKLAVFTGLDTGFGFGFTGLSPTFTGWTAITGGDFNGDAASDVLLQNTTTGAAEIAFMNTHIGFFVQVDAVDAITSPGLGWNAISSGDFNGDGDSDILWQNSSTGALDVSLMNGATGTPTAVGNPGTGYTAVGTGDFNGDGMSDILLRNNASGDAQIWLMNGATRAGTAINVTGPGAGYTLLGAEDINRDGFSDLLWQNSTTGDVMVQEMTTNGTPLGGLVSVGAPGSAFRLVASTGGG